MPGNRLAWGITSKYEISLVDPEANLTRKIARDYIPRRIPDDYRTRILDLIPPQLKTSTRFCDEFPAFDFLCADDQGRLFVKTFDQDKETGQWLLNVFDEEGRYLTRAALAFPFETYIGQEGKLVIKAGKAYVKDNDKDGFPVIRRYKIVEATRPAAPRKCAGS